jgi:hypothetical protein
MTGAERFVFGRLAAASKLWPSGYFGAHQITLDRSIVPNVNDRPGAVLSHAQHLGLAADKTTASNVYRYAVVSRVDSDAIIGATARA